LITNKDRSYYFGASDTKYIVGNWNTKSFEKWWLIKLGLNQSNYTNESMMAGTNFEHKILDSLELKDLEKDKQIIIDRLRINLDGNTPIKIYEVKTYRYEKGFKMPKDYIEQVLVQMYGSGKKEACIVAYGLLDDDYKNYFNEIDKSRLSFYEVEYDERFINEIYIPRLEYLTECIKKGTFPKKSEGECYEA
jgi:hypothetical protein